MKTDTLEKEGICGLKLVFQREERLPALHLTEISRLLSMLNLPQELEKKAVRVFQILFQATMRAYSLTGETVHLENGDALHPILEVGGFALALESISPEYMGASPLPLGSGWARKKQGLLPLPSPLTLEIIREQKIPCYGLRGAGELINPVGAAMLAVFCSRFETMPQMTLDKVGCGLGGLIVPYPSMVRALLGKMNIAQPGDSYEEGILSAPLEIIEANIDDLNPEIYEHVLDCLFAQGALDVYLTPVQMKKNRPSVKITILANPEKASLLGGVLLRETSTLGYRRFRAEKIMLPRKQVVVETPWGAVRVKLAGTPPHYHNIAPEYRDCLHIAREKGIPLKKVYQAVWKYI